jgi:hypothetical protein
LVVIERADMHVPCVVHAKEVALLVQPETGATLVDFDFVQVEANREATLTLPPSHGSRWDTPPWLSSHPEPTHLVSGDALLSALAKVSRTRRGQESR